MTKDQIFDSYTQNSKNLNSDIWHRIKYSIPIYEILNSDGWQSLNNLFLYQNSKALNLDIWQKVIFSILIIKF